MTSVAETSASSTADLFAHISRNGITVDIPGLIKKIQSLQSGELEQLEELTSVTDFTSLKQNQKDLISRKDERFNPRSKKHINAWMLENGHEELKGVSEAALETVLPASLFELIMTSRRSRKFWGDLQTLRNHTAGDNQIHVAWTEAATGRWYTGKPPIQTMAKVCREFLIPSPGNVFYVIDWAQQELRILAHLSGEPSLQRAFMRGDDPHLVAFTKVVGPIDPNSDREIQKQQRDIGKMLNYALIYGLDAQGLGSRLKIPNDRAQALIDEYFEQFPVLANWRQEQRTKVETEGYVETLGGRRIEVTPDEGRRDSAEQVARKAVNYLCQGSAADQLVSCLRNLYDTDTGPSFNYIKATIHDALLIEIPEADAESEAIHFGSVMEQEFFGIAAPVDTKGPAQSWKDCMEWVDEES